MNRKENFTAGFIRENPVFSLYLGLCSTLAITTSLNNAIGMGVAVIIVLIMSNVIISLVRNITPNEIQYSGVYCYHCDFGKGYSDADQGVCT